MTTDELLVECKKGLGMPVTSTAFDGGLRTKVLAVTAYMTGAGVSSEAMISDLAVGAIVIGVTDLWNIQGGDVKFSPVFHTLVTQLAL